MICMQLYVGMYACVRACIYVNVYHAIIYIYTGTLWRCPQIEVSPNHPFESMFPFYTIQLLGISFYGIGVNDGESQRTCKAVKAANSSSGNIKNLHFTIQKISQ